MTQKNRKCDSCLWGDICGGDGSCDNYSPIDPTEEDLQYYMSCLAEAHQEYDGVVEEYLDGRRDPYGYL